MQLKPSKNVLVKRRLLNYLIAFESILLVCLTALAVEVRHVGVDLTYRSDLKETLLLIAFPIIWLCCLSLFGAWDLTILDNHIDGYRRLMRSSFMTFLTFSSTSYLFKIQIYAIVLRYPSSSPSQLLSCASLQQAQQNLSVRCRYLPHISSLLTISFRNPLELGLAVCVTVATAQVSQYFRRSQQSFLPPAQLKRCRALSHVVQLITSAYPFASQLHFVVALQPY